MPEEVDIGADIRMISGCEDHQTSADVSSVAAFSLPNPCGRAGGACTSTLLNILYKDHQDTSEDLTFTEVMEKMRVNLKAKNFTQIPQLSASKPIDMTTKFDLVPNESTGTRRAVMIGINYVGHNPGELSGCQNDVFNMKSYIQDVHGFEEENITLLLDKDGYTQPTKENILNAYKAMVEAAQPGDSLFCHYSGHGTKLKDDDGDEADGYDEALVPLDFKTVGMIRDDDLFETIIQKLPEGVHLVCLMDCCHSGSILDLPYIFTADGSQTEMQPNSKFDIDTWCSKLGSDLGGKLGARLGRKFLGAKGASMGKKMGEKFGSALGGRLGGRIGGMFGKK